MKCFFLLILAFAIPVTFLAQSPTVGLVYTGDSTALSPGYTLFSPSRTNEVYLIDKCGNVVNEWQFTQRPALTCYLLENGNLLRAGRDSLEIRDWNNNLVWSYGLEGVAATQHHDIEPLPNGNILLLTRETIPRDTLLEMGLDSTNAIDEMLLDRVVEIQPNGPGEALVVWEWGFKERLIQDFDSSKSHYGEVAQEPGRLDLNYEAVNARDYTHCNSVAYHPELDQIMLSARHVHEIYIIDHSTSTAEASGHSGGIYGKGGDFLWRWGNPEVFRAGDAADRKIGRQHDAQWIWEGVHAGRISLFNNDGDLVNFGSSVHVLEPVETNGVYAMGTTGFLPDDFQWSWSGSVMGTVMHGNSRCGFQMQPNGNGLMTETLKGRITEVDSNGQILWVYINPIADSLMPQYQAPSINFIFRGERYAPDYAGFENLPQLVAAGPIENENALSEACSPQVGIAENPLMEIYCYPNPSRGPLRIGQLPEEATVTVLDLHGRVVRQGQEASFDLSDEGAGLYFVRIQWEGQEVALKWMLE